MSKGDTPRHVLNVLLAWSTNERRIRPRAIRRELQYTRPTDSGQIEMQSSKGHRVEELCQPKDRAVCLLIDPRACKRTFSEAHKVLVEHTALVRSYTTPRPMPPREVPSVRLGKHRHVDHPVGPVSIDQDGRRRVAPSWQRQKSIPA